MLQGFDGEHVVIVEPFFLRTVLALALRVYVNYETMCMNCAAVSNIHIKYK